MVEVLRLSSKPEIKNKGWSGIQRWLEWVRERLTPATKEDLRHLLERAGVIGEGMLVLTSTSDLRRWGVAGLTGEKPLVFNGQNISQLLREVPHLAEVLADSVGARDVEELMAGVFSEVNFLGLYFPHQPYNGHLLRKSGLINQLPHPQLMARWKVFHLEMMLYLAEVSSSEWPSILGLDTVNALVGMNPSQLKYYGLPLAFQEIVASHPVVFLDKIQEMFADLGKGSGVTESWWEGVIDFVSGLGQLSLKDGRRLVVVNGGFVGSQGKEATLFSLQSFRPVRGSYLPPYYSIPGGVDTTIGPGGRSPLVHLGGVGIVNGRKVCENPPLGALEEAFNSSREFPDLARVMMGVRGFPGEEIALVLGLFGAPVDPRGYSEKIVSHPDKWMKHAV